MARLVVLLVGAAWCLGAQFQLFKVTASVEMAVGAQYDVGTILPGGSRDVSFRLRNTGTTSATLTVLSAAGVGFSIPNGPALPEPLASGSAVDFTVHFAPNAAGFFSAVLTADGISVILLGAGAATAAGGTVYLEQSDGARLLLHAGATVDFGTIPRVLPSNGTSSSSTRRPRRSQLTT